jgi:hypothetical protein
VFRFRLQVKSKVTKYSVLDPLDSGFFFISMHVLVPIHLLFYFVKLIVPKYIFSLQRNWSDKLDFSKGDIFLFLTTWQPVHAAIKSVVVTEERFLIICKRDKLGGWRPCHILNDSFTIFVAIWICCYFHGLVSLQNIVCRPPPPPPRHLLDTYIEQKATKIFSVPPSCYIHPKNII